MTPRATAAALTFVLGAGAAWAGDLRPPLVGMTVHTDPQKTVSIELPVNWKEEGPAPITGGVQRWSGWIQPPNADGPDAWVEVSLKPTWSRLELAYWGVRPGWQGKIEEGTVKRGEGWVEEIRQEKEKQKFLIMRLIEKEGRVYELVAYAHDSIYPHIDAHLHAILDTFKVISKAPIGSAPAGCTESLTDGVRLCTDTKDKKTVQRVLATHADVWKAGAATLPGDPAIADPPLVVVCDKDPAYTELAKHAASIVSPTCVPVYEQRMLAVRVAGKSNGSFDRDVQYYSALQFVQYHFGGKCPEWVDRGLGVWITVSAMTKGKPEKPPAEFVKNARTAAATRKETLVAALDLQRESIPPTEYENFVVTCYAWHCFFRFGAGEKEYGERYRHYLDELRSSGSPDEAKKAWDGVDMPRLSTEFSSWVASWH